MKHYHLQGNRTTTKIFLYIKPSTSRKLQLFYIHHVPADANAQKTRENEIRAPNALYVCGNYPPKNRGICGRSRGDSCCRCRGRVFVSVSVCCRPASFAVMIATITKHEQHTRGAGEQKPALPMSWACLSMITEGVVTTRRKNPEAVGIPAVDVVAVSLCLCPSAVALLPFP